MVKEQKVQAGENDKKFQELNDEDDFNSRLGAGGQDAQSQEHGALVKKILESKEQLEYGSEMNRSKDFVNHFNFIKEDFLFTRSPFFSSHVSFIFLSV